ncbi:programmed cell death protein 5-like isoform X2 [Halichondria panicea]|uniref:programmed cell death protein 5-like isoform X2 n=1 Tax=Halichondria panicea TaxID=6063 RepID=UPI00312B5D02
MAEESDLEAIRARRMAELQQQFRGQGGGGGGGNPEKQKQMMEQQAKQEEMKNMMLTQILEQNARARLNSIALVKPERARQVEGMLIQMAQSGQIGGKVSDKQLVELLETISRQTQKKTTIKVV